MVLLFSGHMVDKPDRVSPRFPPALESVVKTAIDSEIARLDAGPNDVAISSAACGGDILFAEAVLNRGVPLSIYLPLEESSFLERSVTFANDRWLERYRAVIQQSQQFIAPRELGALPEGINPFEQTNQWMLNEARRVENGNLVLICLWDGEDGNKHGGTKHMIDTIQKVDGSVRWIDIRIL